MYLYELSNKISKFFPPPSFLEIPATGIDISDRAIKFLKFERMYKGLRIAKYGKVDIPAGVVVAGEIKDKEALKDILLKIKDKYDLDFVRMSLPEEKAYLYKTEVPIEAVHNINEAVSFTLEENVPISPQDVVFDSDILLHQKDKEHMDVSVSAFPKGVVESYESVCLSAGLKPLSMEIEAIAITRAIIRRGDMGTYLIMDFGGTRSTLFVVSQGLVRFTVTIEIGGDSLTRSVEKYKNLSFEEAEKFKRKTGFIKNRDNNELFLSMMGTVSALKDEINRYYIYWHTHLSKDGGLDRKIEKLILCGGEANLLGLSEYLSATLKIKVETSNVWTNVFSLDEYIPEILCDESLAYATAIGLALRTK